MYFIAMNPMPIVQGQQSATENRLIRFLNNRKIAEKILILILPLFVLASGGLAGVTWSAYKQYQRSQTLRTANAVSDLMLRASAEQARERGFTATALANPNDRQTREKIALVRQQGDDALDSALKSAEPILAKNPQAAEKVRFLLEKRKERNAVRRTADAMLGVQSASQEQVVAWISAQTAVILAERSFANAVFASENPLETILEMNSRVKSSVLNVSEFAGRERANIGTIIAGGQPIPPERLNLLMQYRGVVQENIAMILDYGKNTAVPIQVRQRIATMEQVFMRDFEQIRKVVYAASAEAKPYPINSAEWISTSTNAINSIIAVSEAVSTEAQHLAEQEFAESFRTVMIASVALMVLFLVLVVSFLLSNSIISRLVRLQSVAKNIATGDFSPIALRQDRDEIGEVSASFSNVLTTIRHFNASQQTILEHTMQGNMAMRTETSEYEGGFRAMADGMNALLDAVNRPVREALDVLQFVADGDFTHRMTGEYAGDHAKLKDSINTATEAISEALANVLETSHHILQGAEQVASASQSLSQGAIEQAASLQEITSSLQMIAAQITHTAHEATGAATVSSGSRAAAERGDNEMKRLTTAMRDINASSNNIAGIIRVIDEIAFQTNLLALNAAIEAARAGRYGKGFAVVAEEVRSLAARSAKAAKQTSGMIDEAGRNAAIGSSTADETAQHLREIVNSSQKVAVVVNDIASSAQAQAGGISEINTGLHQIDKVVQMTAANAEECSAAAYQLEMQAKNLNQMLSRFRIAEQHSYAAYR